VKWSTSEVTYDPEVDMAYVRVVEVEAGASKKRVVVHHDDLPRESIIDLDRNGRILGFELFNGSQSLPLDLLHQFR
jgi:uncharacterized protein YuzE